MEVKVIGIENYKKHRQRMTLEEVKIEMFIGVAGRV